MVDPLQFGLPGAVELLIIILIFLLLLIIPVAIGYWVSQEAKYRGSNHHVAWGVMTFLLGFAGLIPLVVFVIFYLIVRDDIGPPGGEQYR